MLIKVDDLQDQGIMRLLEEHRREMFQYSPPESIHALDVAELKHPSLTFWSAWQGDQIAGCGALKELSETHAEVKSMRTAKVFLRRGVSSRLLEVMLSEAKSRGYRRLSLETGTHKAFEPAIALYRKFGFMETAPFGEYSEDPHSLFMTKFI
ncbi:GNAT family N-acetyltransferase [Kangiella sediminilitoris]|uniref:GNAT family N-acetyltransferase n=1 Tax=Kangiella sediminilitoris TaxID=1144748 RepID=UPI00083D1A38